MSRESEKVGVNERKAEKIKKGKERIKKGNRKKGKVSKVLVSLSNGISIFVGYLMPNPSL